MSTRSSTRRIAATLLAGAACAFLLAGCATPSGSSGTSPFGTAWPEPPSGTVTAQGTVMDVGGDVELCLGAVAESYPPQCQGIPMVGWTWDGVDGSETSGDVTWGAYAVTGTFDGETFTSTEAPIMLALYDPMPQPDPTDGATGAGDDATLAEIQEELPAALGDDLLSSWADRGYLWVQVVWDDGTLQSAADAQYGAETVVIQSAMHEVG